MKASIIQKSLLGSAIALAMGTAYAQQDDHPENPSPQEMMRQHDQDSNESLSQEEWTKLYRLHATTGLQEDVEQQAEQAFREADSNNNDEINMSELRQVQPIGQGSNSSNERGVAQVPGHRDQASQQGRQTQYTGSSSRSTAQAQIEPDRELHRSGDDNPSIAQSDQESSDRSQSQTGSQSQRGRDQGQSQVAQRHESQGQSSSEMMARQNPEELEDREIMDRQEVEIGEIEQIVRHTGNGELYAVVTSGGFAGISEDHSVIPISELEEHGERLIYNGQRSQLQNYEESRYEEIKAEVANTAQRQQDEAEKRAQQVTGNSSQEQHQQQETRSLLEMAKRVPGALEGMEIRDGQTGSVIGNVELVVLDKQNAEFFIVMSSDEVLGMGGRDMVVALKELERSEGSLMLNSPQTALPFAEDDFLKVEEF